MKVLLVEDDVGLSRSLRRGFDEAGWTCTWAPDGATAIRELAQGPFAVLILDLMLPDMNGLDVLPQVKRLTGSPAVLVLTALGSVEERVLGLQAGADDYLVKPFAFVELLARMDALCRRASACPITKIAAGPVILDLTTRRVVRAGKEIELTPTEFSLLEFLMRHDGHPVSRRMLCEHLWDANWEGVTNVIEVHVNRLRAKLDRGFANPLIETIRGLGYAFRAS